MFRSPSRILTAGAVIAFAANAPVTRADDVVYSYDGDVLPYDPSAGFEIFDACEPPCEESVENGHFVLQWTAEPWRETARYNIFLGDYDNPAPPFWAEWQFRSNHPLVNSAIGCDAAMQVQFQGIEDLVYMSGDSVVDQSIGGYILGLDPTEFHTFRFDCLDGAHFTLSVDGQVFWSAFDDQGQFLPLLQIIGEGGCIDDPFQNTKDEWDFVRWGHQTSGEQIVAVDPPPGNLTVAQANQLERFTITFDQPNFLFIDDIDVSVSGGIAPTIAATKRLENGSPNVLQVVLDGHLPSGETTTFTIDTGTGPQSVAYTVIQPDVPATSAWGVVVAALLTLIAGTAVFRRRGAWHGQPSRIAVAVALFALAANAPVTRADDVVYSYDGDVLPYDPSAGFEIFDACEPPCEESLENGHFVLQWTAEPWRETARYNIFLGDYDNPAPPFWAEWQFRSNHPLVNSAVGCDAKMALAFKGISDLVYITGDSAIDGSIGGYVVGLDLTEFHTFRFDCLDGAHFTLSVDGQVFWSAFDNEGQFLPLLQIIGEGGCIDDPFQNTKDEWDFVRWGHQTSGEQIVAVDPPPGNLTVAQANQLERFTITFDQPNFLFIDDIDVSVSGGIAPMIAATKRLENGSPNVLQVVLDGHLPSGETTTFTIDTGTGPQTFAYTVIQPDVPATSQWGVVVAALLTLIAGTAVFQRRSIERPN